MRIIFFSSADFGIPSLEAIKASDNDLVHIFTQPARQAGRHRKLKPTPVAQWAQENSIPCTEAANINSPQIVEQLKDCKADLLVVISFGQKISNEVLALPTKGAINVHGSLLPKYRGASPTNQPIINGDKEAGVTIITVAEKMDAGETLGYAKIAVEPDDTAETLYQKLADISPPPLIKAIEQIAEGKAVYTPQDESAVTYAPKLKKQDGFIDFAGTAESIRNRIHGLWSWPGAQANFLSAETGKCIRVTFARAEVLPNQIQQAAPGTLDENLNIICGDGALKIEKIKPANSALMDFKAFVNGRHIKPGDRFISIEKAD